MPPGSNNSNDWVIPPDYGQPPAQDGFEAQLARLHGEIMRYRSTLDQMLQQAASVRAEHAAQMAAKETAHRTYVAKLEEEHTILIRAIEQQAAAQNVEVLKWKRIALGGQVDTAADTAGALSPASDTPGQLALSPEDTALVERLRISAPRSRWDRLNRWAWRLRERVRSLWVNAGPRKIA